MKRAIKWTLLLLLVAGAIWITNLIWFRPFNINHFYERIFIEFALKNPELLSSLTHARTDGDEFHNVVLRNGAMPLQILEQQLDNYISASL